MTLVHLTYQILPKALAKTSKVTLFLHQHCLPTRPTLFLLFFLSQKEISEKQVPLLEYQQMLPMLSVDFCCLIDFAIHCQMLLEYSKLFTVTNLCQIIIIIGSLKALLRRPAFKILRVPGADSEIGWLWRYFCFPNHKNYSHSVFKVKRMWWVGF